MTKKKYKKGYLNLYATGGELPDEELTFYRDTPASPERNEKTWKIRTQKYGKQAEDARNMIDSNRQWLLNWYNESSKLPQFADQLDEQQMKVATHRIANSPVEVTDSYGNTPSNGVARFSSDSHIPYDKVDPTIRGAAVRVRYDPWELNRDARYQTSSDVAYNKDLGLNILHELEHTTQMSDMGPVDDNFSKRVMKTGEILGTTPYADTPYESRPTEVLARRAEMLKEMKANPTDRNYDGKWYKNVKHLLKKYKLDYGEDKTLKLFNDVADSGVNNNNEFPVNYSAYGGRLYAGGGILGALSGANKAMDSSKIGGLLGGASGISGIAGGIASAASNAISGGMSTGVGGAMQTIGGIASNIPGVGGLIGAGVNVLGGLVNRAFGSQINEEFVNETKDNANNQLGAQIDDSSFDSVLEQQSTNRGMDALTRSQVGKDGWFSNKAKNLTKDLNKKIENANSALRMNFANAIGNVEENQNLDVMANYSAYGGQLFKDGGGIHIKKANRGKFTEYCGGKVTSECIARGKHSSSPAVRKRATFAQNARGWHHSFGGWLNTQGGDFSNGITIVGNGGTHEQNPNEGVQMGVDPQGMPNLVEEGEVVFNDYVFSNRLKVPKKDRKRLKLKEGTFADAAEKLQKESSERPNDPISNRGLEVSMNRLAGIQEGVRERKSGNKFADGGKKRNYRDIEVPMAGINTDYSSQLPTRLAAPKGVTPIEEQVPDNDLAPTWMRYAPAVGSALGVFSDAIGLTNTPDYAPAEMVGEALTPVKPVGARQISNRLTYKPLDTSYELNKLDANQAAQRRALINTSGGNRATAAANLLAANANYGNQMGDLHRQAELFNLNQRQQIEGFNRGTNQFNAEAQMKADLANAQQAQQMNELRLKQKSAQAQMYDTANMRSSMGRAANLTNLFDNLGGIGQENFSRNMITSNPALLYDLDSSGRVQYKKNKKKKGGRLTYGR